MKQILLALSIATFFAACKGKDDSNLKTNRVMLTDTTAIYNGSSSSDTGTAMQRGEKPTRIYSHQKPATDRRETNSSGTSEKSTASTSTVTTTKKKGWSNRAKGAVIGGAAGAVGGAIISKHKGTGAVIGGLAGAAGGYIIGNEKDKKNNR